MDERRLAIAPWLGNGSTVVCASLEIPGASELPRGATALFAWALGQLKRALPAARQIHAMRDARGPFELWGTPGAAIAVKRRCVSVEACHPAARLLDVDVYAPDGIVVDRASLLLPPRKCLLCAAPAAECLRTKRHAPEALLAKACELLGPFRS